MHWVYLLCALTCDSPTSSIQTPKATDDRLVVELVAREPEIVTPTGVAVDERGRIWVIENQTHQRPANYQGASSDRIRIYDDFQSDGQARRVTTFADGFKDSMGLALARNGDVYYATRAQIMVLRDLDGDGVADRTEVIARLETSGDYPHNGLSGFAFDAFDNVYFGCGENLGADYKLIGSDGVTLSGGGEGGNIYRCGPDGSQLTRVATGFWNPFHLTFDAFGRLFAVDNDPDSRPPCRLLHIIQGGDYGYRYRNGRKGLHPFTAWNGELPGTLPMVAGTGEAPSGIVAYESNGLPSEYVGDLIVTSWGDHVIQRFRLHERGASFSSQGETLVRGDDNFYPVGIATAPDGSLIVTDWADKSYPVHGKGRIWRIRMKQPPADDGLRTSGVRKLQDAARAFELLEHPKQEIRHAAGYALASVLDSSAGDPKLAVKLQNAASSAGPIVDSRLAIHALWTLARSVKAQPALVRSLHGDHGVIRAESARILGEVIRARPGTSELERPLVDMLAGVREPAAFVLLQAISAVDSEQACERILPYLANEDPFLRGAAIETLGRSASLDLLRQLRSHEKPAMRVGALLALRRSGRADARQSIADFLKDDEPEIRRAAIQWVGEEHLNEFEPRLQAAVSTGPLTRPVFEAFLAAKELLSGVVRKPSEELSGEDFIAKIFNDEDQPISLRALAIRSLRPDHPGLVTDKLVLFVGGSDATMRIEAIHTLAARSDSASQQVLRRIAADKHADAAIRTQAVVGLGHSAGVSEDTARLLIELMDTSSSAIRAESLRSLRAAAKRPEVINAIRNRLQKAGGFATVDERELAEMVLHTRPSNEPSTGTKDRAAEVDRLIGTAGELGDRAAGERVFFHPNGPQCFACHRVNGRGGIAGPDLSAIGRTLDRSKIVRSILEPSKDIAPQFTPWLFALRDGRVASGIILIDDPRGVVTVGDVDGKSIDINTADIVDRKALDRSIMPDNIADRMTHGELRDLLAFLASLQ